MQNQTKHMIDEADVGSGEKQPGQEEAEKIIEQIGEREQGTHQEGETRNNGQKDIKKNSKK
jgi:hypothetical protein